MNVFYNNSRLMETISDIYELTGIWINIHDLSGEDIHIRNAHCDFCRTINDLPEGHARCLSCDAKASNICRSIKAPYHYRCHAGMCETLVPIFNNGEVISYLGFGQLLDESPLEEQWNFTKNTLSWYPDDLENLRKKFYEIRQYPHSKTLALTKILQILSSHVEVSNTIVSTRYTDQQRLKLYISKHFAEPLTIKSITSDLNFGATKLCELAKNISNGHSLTWLIASARVEAAQSLLISSDMPISEIALIVGYEDYNYFTKVFKKIVGITPSKYRRTQARQLPPPHTDHETFSSMGCCLSIALFFHFYRLSFRPHAEDFFLSLAMRLNMYMPAQ